MSFAFILVGLAVAIPAVAFITAKIDPTFAYQKCPACGHTIPNFVSFEEKLAQEAPK